MSDRGLDIQSGTGFNSQCAAISQLKDCGDRVAWAGWRKSEAGIIGEAHQFIGVACEDIVEGGTIRGSCVSDFENRATRIR